MSNASKESDEKVIRVKPPIVVRDFASLIGLKPFKLISELMETGIFASMNQSIEESIASKIAEKHGFKLEIHHRGDAPLEVEPKKSKPLLDEDDPKLLKPRPPICCIMGHVDHGKTTLLDTLRKTNIVKSEAGGITQHVGAYQLEHKDNKITFIDTPGHSAFSKMRSRGANVTDITILVVAADDGFKPQTLEALKLAKQANNALIVAINKIDAKGANIDEVKKQMQDKGIASEDWGGETLTVEISALKSLNIDTLLDAIQLQAEMLELKSNPNANPQGTIIESQLELGRGAVSSVIVEKGTLKCGDALVSGESYCRIKSMMNENGDIIQSAPPSTPLKILGWSEVPKSGEKFNKEKNEKIAKNLSEIEKNKRKISKSKDFVNSEGKKESTSVEDLFAAISNQKNKSLRLIVKSDVNGSLEALISGLQSIESKKINLDIISEGVGNITKTDVTLAGTSDAFILGFNVKLDSGVQSLAKHESVTIIQHNIIYELLNEVEDSMVSLLETEKIEKKVGEAEVRQVFVISKGRKVAGCMVTDGLISRSSKVRLVRSGKLIYEGQLETLRRFKDDAKEVRSGFECGINIKGCNDYLEGDLLECLQIEEKKPSL